MDDGKEIQLNGIAAAPGIALGHAYVYSKLIPHVQVKDIDEEGIKGEIERLRAAVARSEKELQKILSFAEQKLGPQNAKIFEAQIMILHDQVLMGTIEKRIRQERKNSEFIVFDEIGKYKRLMLAAADEYMHERAHDVEDVMNRIIRNVQDQKLVSRLEGESIIVSESLTPADTVIFSRNQILGYATDMGGITSHAALLSRSLKIPAVVGLRNATKAIQTGDLLALDGYSGVLVVNPTMETIDGMRRKAQRFREFEQNLVGIAKLPAETIDHKRVELSSNIEFPDEVEFSIEQGSQGIGLYRTESQLIGRNIFPNEDELAEEYTQVAEGVFPHPVIFRTFDIGGDKLSPTPYHEDNPFLGWRGIRISLDRPDMFLAQLRAILRASKRKNVRILLPMVSRVSEVRRAKTLLKQAKDQLKAKGIPFDTRVKIGIMVEVPSAAILANEMAMEVDFMSIGTNDLVQYLLAVDRGNSAVSSLYAEFHPAVLRTIKMIIEAGHKNNVWVGMCGEMAGNPLATMLLVGLGLDELSVIPSLLPEIKKIIRSIKFKDAKRVAEKVLTLPTESEIHNYLSTIVKGKVPELPLEV